MLTLILTFLPSILILLFFILLDKFKEPKTTTLLVFFLGFYGRTIARLLPRD